MLIFWTLQAVWVFCVVLPCVYVNGVSQDPDMGVVDYLGLFMMVVGFLCEVAADMQKYAFRNDPSNKGLVCTVGLWGYSRHPNYFGEVFFWWGVFASVSPLFSEEAWGWATIVSPFVTMSLLLLVSGIPLAEGV